MNRKMFCLNCRKTVDTYTEVLKGFSLCCKECGSTRLMMLEDTNEEEFKELAKKFKEQTGEMK